ncbi:MAG TPA: hypothetical protein VLW50_05080 [Streptosporangiaceae bacterium]|nr:hypothetical protein [Streptosporangiaceae bacterium]
MRCRAKFAIPDGWAARSLPFEVEWPDDPDAAARIRSRFRGAPIAVSHDLPFVRAIGITRWVELDWMTGLPESDPA